jgi:hypothetical protein
MKGDFGASQEAILHGEGTFAGKEQADIIYRAIVRCTTLELASALTQPHETLTSVMSNWTV